MDFKRPPSTATFQSPAHDRQHEESGESDRRVRAHGRVGALLLDRFELLELVGVGAFGEVYRARDRQNPNTPLAIKFLGRSSAHALYLFKREFRALSEWAHPNLVKLHELFLDGDVAFFTMEFVSGVDFLRYVRPDGALSEARLVSALHALSEGVQALHGRGYVHRDLKPSNVLVEPSGRVVIVDLGLATLFSHGEGASEVGFSGTPQYAAPEQLALAPVGPEADWYAVGTILYEALSGSLPYEASFSDLLAAKRQAPAPLPESCSRAEPRASTAHGALAALSATCLGLLQPDKQLRAGFSDLRAALGEAFTPAQVALPPLVGRGEQLALLRQIFAQVELGAPQVVVLEGRSGFGKTSLADSFLQELKAEYRAVVLRGRCYVNEEVTYQTVDGNIDALSHHLRALPNAKAAALLPRDVRALAHVFPVLNRVDSIASALPVRSAEDKASLRERASEALRELLARLSDRLPVVLFIDDVQWDDADSAGLLAAVLSAPDPPAVMLLMTCRSEGRSHSHLLRALETSAVTASRIRTLSLPALSKSETMALVARCIPEADVSPALAERVAVESEGHPLFAIELSRFTEAHRADGEDAGQVSLDDALRRRAGQVSPAARRLLEVACVAGRPLQYAIAVSAAACELSALRELMIGKLLTSSGSQKEDTLSVYHDRIREAVLAALPPEQERALHATLARALAADGQRFDLIVDHFLAADERLSAARYALRAADQTAAVLAFHRVPALLLLAIEAAEPSQKAALYLRLGEAYALIGRTRDAAGAYQAGAELEPDPEQRWELSSLAMWQAFHARDYERGDALLRALDDALGELSFRPTLARYVGVAMRGLSWRIAGPPALRQTDGSRVTEADRRRLRLAFRACTGLIESRPLAAIYYAVWALQLAGKLGDVSLYSVLLALFAASESVSSGRSARRIEGILARASDLSAKQPDLSVRAFVEAIMTGYAFVVAQLELAERRFSPLVDAPFPPTPLGTLLRSMVLYLMGPPLLFMTGRIAKVQTFAARTIAHAHDRGDAHTEHGLRALMAFRFLASDDEELAWSEWQTTLDRYPAHEALRTASFGVVPALYAGRLDRAEQVLAVSRRLFFSWEAYVSTGRTTYLWWWGAVAAARVAAGERSLALRLRLWAASVALSLRPAVAHAPFVPCLRAARAFARGEKQLGIAQLEQARAGFHAGGMRLFAACADHALSALHSDPEQRAVHAARAQAIFDSEQIRVPDKWLRALLPGIPSPSSP